MVAVAGRPRLANRADGAEDRARGSLQLQLAGSGLSRGRDTQSQISVRSRTQLNRLRPCRHAGPSMQFTRAEPLVASLVPSRIRPPKNANKNRADADEGWHVPLGVP